MLRHFSFGKWGPGYPDAPPPLRIRHWQFNIAISTIVSILSGQVRDMGDVKYVIPRNCDLLSTVKVHFSTIQSIHERFLSNKKTLFSSYLASIMKISWKIYCIFQTLVHWPYITFLIITSLYKPVNFNPRYSQNCVTIMSNGAAFSKVAKWHGNLTRIDWLINEKLTFILDHSPPFDRL